MTKLKTYSFVIASAFLVLSLAVGKNNPTNIQKNSVMIANKALNHGGTGIIYKSSDQGSFVLTNRHVCEVVNHGGGVVKTSDAIYQVESIFESAVSDLCFVYVPSNLHQNTKVAKNYPKTFSPAKVSGHPALMPTVISTGHFSERQIIQVFMGIRPCTDDEVNSDALLCAIFGGYPILKSYDAQLVTATIMPGSSGSGVYNKNNELSGVVFAGQGDFGYAWIVNYDELTKFLNIEAPAGKLQLIDQTIQLATQEKTDIQRKCLLATDKNVLKACNAMNRDMTW